MNNYKHAIILLVTVVLGWVGVSMLNSAGQKEAPAVSERPAALEQQPVAGPNGVPVLMYHSIGYDKNNDAVISPERFAEHMAYLYEQGYKTITLDELAAYLNGSGRLPTKAVAITFDDGYRDTYEIALPLLKKYGFKSTLFIPAAELGKNLKIEQLKEMKAAGMAVASHSLNHRELAVLSPEQQAQEIYLSKKILDEALGQDTKHFCYPYGSHNEATLKLLRQYGFVLAVTIEPGWAKPGDNVLILKRVWMGNGVDLKIFKERLTTPDYSIL